jgi:hypothetical protein
MSATAVSVSRRQEGLLTALLSPPHGGNVSFYRQQCRKGLAVEPDVVEA